MDAKDMPTQIHNQHCLSSYRTKIRLSNGPVIKNEFVNWIKGITIILSKNTTKQTIKRERGGKKEREVWDVMNYGWCDKEK